jgi:hypothetical protein
VKENINCFVVFFKDEKLCDALVGLKKGAGLSFEFLGGKIFQMCF